jgi:hypothetical protein
MVQKFVATNGVMLQEWGHKPCFVLCCHPVEPVALVMLTLCGILNPEWSWHPFHVTSAQFWSACCSATLRWLTTLLL